jgi:Bacterial regulatory protein, Fis family/Recombinase
MARLTKAEAARQLGISRTTLYKLIDQGKVSATPDGLIDTAELARVVSTLDVHHERLAERPRTLLDNMSVDSQLTADEHHEHPGAVHHERPAWTDDERQLTSTYQALVDTLREQLDSMRQELEAARAERHAAREERAMLLHMLQDMQQRYDRLLAAPRSGLTPYAPTSAQEWSDAPLPDPILAQVLRWQDEGMTLRAIAARLNAEGVPTRSGHGKWYQSNLSRELRRLERRW